MKNTKGASRYAVEIFGNSNDDSVHSAVINIVLFGLMTVTLLWWVILIVFVVVFIMDIMCLISQLAINSIGLIKHKLKEKTKRTLKELDSSKIEVFPLDSEANTLSHKLITDICNEIVRDQIGRALDENEKVSVMESNNLVDESVLVIFRYRSHDKKKIRGSTKDKLTSSVHTVRLTLNKLAQSVHIENVMSVDSDSVSHLNDPKGFIRDSLTPFTGPCSKEINTSVVKQMISD